MKHSKNKKPKKTKRDGQKNIKHTKKEKNCELVKPLQKKIISVKTKDKRTPKQLLLHQKINKKISKLDTQQKSLTHFKELIVIRKKTNY